MSHPPAAAPAVPPALRSASSASRALLLGVAFVMLSNGLQGSLVSLRASIEGFSTPAIGIMMASFYIGFLGGTLWTPPFVQRVGHVRVFAALASAASAAVLVHLALLHPFTWSLVRLAAGFCMAGLYVVAESWLNDLATNETRGRVLGRYMIVSVGGLGGGQLLLMVADPAGFELFVIASVLVSLALVPVVLSVAPAPAATAPQSMPLRSVAAIAPLGLAGVVGAGVTQGSVLGMGAVYAQAVGLSVPQTAAFIGASIAGGVLVQTPVSRLSDTRDRRVVIACASLLAAAAAAVGGAASGNPAMVLAAMALFGAGAWPIYSLSVAHTNDWLTRDQVVGAASTLVLASGVGAIAGPLLVAGAMHTVGPDGFFAVVGLSHLAVGVYALHRLTVRPRAARQRPVRYLVWAARAATVATSLTGRVRWQTRPETTGGGGPELMRRTADGRQKSKPWRVGC